MTYFDLSDADKKTLINLFRPLGMCQSCYNLLDEGNIGYNPVTNEVQVWCNKCDKWFTLKFSFVPEEGKPV